MACQYIKYLAHARNCTATPGFPVYNVSVCKKWKSWKKGWQHKRNPYFPEIGEGCWLAVVVSCLLDVVYVFISLAVCSRYRAARKIFKGLKRRDTRAEGGSNLKIDIIEWNEGKNGETRRVEEGKRLRHQFSSFLSLSPFFSL